MPSDEKLRDILYLIDKKARGFALVALLVNAGLLATIPLLPSDQRIYGFIVFAVVLVSTLISMVVIARPASHDHTQPDLGLKVTKLKEQLVEHRFLPQLIIAIPRGGLAVAGLLARQLGERDIVPVISLVRMGQSEFANSFNHLNFDRQTFGSDSADPINVLVVDDICRSGRTLNDAKTYIEGMIDLDDFVIQTAALAFYDSHSRATPPSFWVERPKEAIRDASGDEEEWPD